MFRLLFGSADRRKEDYRSPPETQSSKLTPAGPSNIPNDEFQSEELTKNDIIIAVMGSTGTGKSSFIARATGNGDRGVGHLLTSYTKDIEATRCTIEGSNVVLVDTPSFDNTNKPDSEILESISAWLTKTYSEETLLSAILYFHRISDNRMAGTPLRNLRIFQKLCGNKAMSRVVLVTTMWDEVDEYVGNERLEELKGNYWKQMIALGSRTYCYQNTYESSRQLLSQLVGRKPFKVSLQNEMVDHGQKLQHTRAERMQFSLLGQFNGPHAVSTY
ncbi:P-loop containing nucleoside triphosphate hydrolase protein [Pisolithus marmoratus]|nr:P-loop containing nucleoside triphosphate hydrolase protein [Pisolithus marmoratus]